LAKGIENWYLLSSRALARLIKAKGFKIEQVGSGCEHRGTRFPFRFNVKEIKDNPIWEQFSSPYQLFSNLSSSNNLTQSTIELSL